MKTAIVPVIAVLGIFAIVFFLGQKTSLQPKTVQTPESSNSSITTSLENLHKTVVATNLEVPWALTVLPNKNILVTERPGKVQLINPKNGEKTLIAEIPEVKQIGEGGLHGIALHPDFATNQFIYLYYTYGSNNDTTQNRVVRFVFDGKTLSSPTIVVDKIPGSLFHNGGRIKFGPDKLLYIATGDAQNPSLAQDKNSLAGKILRVTDNGKPASGNPFNNEVYSYGHRNPQGLTWDSNGQLWETEHGPSAMDEFNKITIGKNYGWPTITGNETKPGYETPILQSDQNTTWAPGGLVYFDNSFYFVGLRAQALYRVTKEGQSFKLTEYFKGEYGRMRDIIVGSDNLLYMSSSNRDGRGIPSIEDDRIIRIDPKKL